MITVPGRKLRGQAKTDALQVFADGLQEIAGEIGFPVSARGWCYELEAHGLTKADFDFVEGLINDCRRMGILPIDFTAEEEGRKFSGVEDPTPRSPEAHVVEMVKDVLEAEYYFTPHWWKGEEYYIQMVVEKVDLKTLFEPVCQEYKIPIATAKGWSSMLMRAEYARRFKRAERRGLKCVLLYCGDHDPDGLRIGEFLRSNLQELSEIVWKDGNDGYDPSSLIIDRFGLNADFILKNNLSWIPNLITGSKKNLADPIHKNNKMPYVQDYIRTYGVRKCEANSLVRQPEQGRLLCRQAIEKYLGEDAVDRFDQREADDRKKIQDFREDSGLREAIEEALKLVKEEGDEEDEDEDE